MSSTALKTEITRRFGSPAVVIDLDVVERNIARTQSMCDAAGIANRPHIKTHKSPVLAAMQRDAGAAGITCQKLGEAEIMAAAGLDNILISYNILGEEKIERLGSLLRDVNVIVAADHPMVADGLTRAAALAGRLLPVTVECDTGRKRAGVETPAEAVALARHIASLPGLSFAGLLLYPPDAAMAAAQGFLDATLAGLKENWLTAEIVSTGGTPNLAHLGELKGVTEHRAGTAIFNDRMMMKAGMAALADCALTVYTTVVSRPTPMRGILDAGSKTLTNDTGGGLDGFGFILEAPEARIAALSEEHGILDLNACRGAVPQIGDVVRVVPNHVCVVVNMVDRCVAVRGDEIIGEMPIVARGKTT